MPATALNMDGVKSQVAIPASNVCMCVYLFKSYQNILIFLFTNNKEM